MFFTGDEKDRSESPHTSHTSGIEERELSSSDTESYHSPSTSSSEAKFHNLSLNVETEIDLNETDS